MFRFFSTLKITQLFMKNYQYQGRHNGMNYLFTMLFLFEEIKSTRSA